MSRIEFCVALADDVHICVCCVCYDIRIQQRTKNINLSDAFAPPLATRMKITTEKTIFPARGSRVSCDKCVYQCSGAITWTHIIIIIVTMSACWCVYLNNITNDNNFGWAVDNTSYMRSNVVFVAAERARCSVVAHANDNFIM